MRKLNRPHQLPPCQLFLRLPCMTRIGTGATSSQRGPVRQILKRNADPVEMRGFGILLPCFQSSNAQRLVDRVVIRKNYRCRKCHKSLDLLGIALINNHSGHGGRICHWLDIPLRHLIVEEGREALDVITVQSSLSHYPPTHS